MKKMPIKEFCTELETTMKAGLDSIGQENSDMLQRIAKSRSVVRGAIDDLKHFVHDYSFRDTKEQIEFFKEIKPIFVSQYYYYDSLFSFTLKQPTGQPELESYCNDALTEIQKYALLHRDFLAYCLSGAINMDAVYFVTSGTGTSNPLEDARFTTGYDLPLSTLLSHRLLQDHISGILKSLRTEAAPSPLTWTSKKAYLVELLYALHEAQVFNDGKAGIKEIASLLETQFNTNLGNYYRHFTEITVRKTNRTNFIDLLKDRLIRRLDTADH
jgi:hypothetical protein